MKKKIVMLLGHDLLLPRVDPRVFKEAKTLLAAGFEVTVISLSDIKRGETFQGIKITRLSDRAKLKNNMKITALPKIIFRYLLNVFAFRRAIAAINPDIIHANDVDTLLSGVLGKLKTKSKLVYDSHELATEIIDSKRYKFPIWLIEKICTPFTDAFITVNESIKKILLKRYPSLNKKTLVLINTPLIKMEKIKPSPVSKDIKFIYQGNLKGGRRELLEKIIKNIGRHKNWHLTLLVDKKDIPRDSELFGNPKILIMDYIFESKKFHKILNQFDVGIVPNEKNCLNNYYSLPNKLFDYMEAAVAVMVTDLPVIKKIVRETDCGYIFTPEKEKSIKETLDEIFLDKKLSNKKANGRIWIENKYNWQAQEKQLVNFYRSI
jgi:glycosyltransferase involved in cell wall biosynthesis